MFVQVIFSLFFEFTGTTYNKTSLVRVNLYALQPLILQHGCHPDVANLCCHHILATLHHVIVVCQGLDPNISIIH